uniref:hypothetical protein n=1 Tax=Ningiella ruwaisensis TaxID=2364274 RepID=UPI00109F7A1B|nr:hypothetical protein [Ningiella ruwaisensis]
MSFKEKSAWVMLISLLVTGILFSRAVLTNIEMGSIIAPSVPLFIGFTIVLTLLSIVGHIVIAALSPKDANGKTDERESRVIEKAGNTSGVIFDVGVVAALLLYLLIGNGDALFYLVFSSLLLASIAEYAIQIYLFRRPMF